MWFGVGIYSVEIYISLCYVAFKTVIQIFLKILELAQFYRCQEMIQNTFQTENPQNINLLGTQFSRFAWTERSNNRADWEKAKVGFGL
jgi:hypothetical protein